MATQTENNQERRSPDSKNSSGYFVTGTTNTRISSSPSREGGYFQEGTGKSVHKKTSVRVVGTIKRK